jgi:hypothetical protein
MILYHFTGHHHIDAIRREGLSKGDVPTSLNEGVNGVWFTSSPEPGGHGIPEKTHDFTPAESAEYFQKTGLRLKGTIGKCDVRITVVIPSTDRALVPWSKWGRKHCDPHAFQTLNRLGAAWRTWFIYWRAIEPARFRAVDVLRPFEGGSREIIETVQRLREKT